MNLLTIVTIVRNDLPGFKATHESLSMKPNSVEWVVVDGASTDGTREYIIENSNKIDFWVSEKDEGIADAFNKGILNSKGEYILFLNAGDKLKNYFFMHADLLFNELKNRNIPIAVGKIDFGGKVVGRKVTANMQLKRNYLPHQGMLIKRSVFSKIGLYDESFKLGMDYEWSLRLISNWSDSFLFSDFVLVYMDDAGLSVTNYKKTFLTYHKARIKHNSTSYALSYLYSLFFIFKRTIGIKVKTLWR